MRPLGDRHENTLIAISNLGSFLQDKGDLDGAEAERMAVPTQLSSQFTSEGLVSRRCPRDPSAPH